MRHYEPNVIVLGQYYRVTYKAGIGLSIRVFVPMSRLEMPMEVGDVITKHSAPRGFDAKLCIECFSELLGVAVTRVVVFDGILFNQDAGHAGDCDSFRPVRRLEHALKLQAKYKVYRARVLERRAAYQADIAGNIYIGKGSDVSLSDAIGMGFGEGWYIRQVGHDVWSIVTLAPSENSSIIFGYRASRYKSLSGDSYSYKRLTETFHPSLGTHIVRKTRPLFGPVVDAEGYQATGDAVKIPYINVA